MPDGRTCDAGRAGAFLSEISAKFEHIGSSYSRDAGRLFCFPSGMPECAGVCRTVRPASSGIVRHIGVLSTLLHNSSN